MKAIVLLNCSPCPITRVGSLENVFEDGRAKICLSNTDIVVEPGKWLLIPEGFKENTFTDGGHLGLNGPLMIKV